MEKGRNCYTFSTEQILRKGPQRASTHTRVKRDLEFKTRRLPHILGARLVRKLSGDETKVRALPNVTEKGGTGVSRVERRSRAARAQNARANSSLPAKAETRPRCGSSPLRRQGGTGEGKLGANVERGGRAAPYEKDVPGDRVSARSCATWSAIGTRAFHKSKRERAGDEP